MNKQIEFLVIFGQMRTDSPLVQVYDKQFFTKTVFFSEQDVSGLKGESVCLQEKNHTIWNLPFKILKRNYTIYKIIKLDNPKAIICQFDQVSISLLPLVLYMKVTGKKTPIYAFIHSGAEEYYGERIFDKVARFFVRHLYFLFTNVLTPSKGNKKMLEKYFSLQNIKVIPNGIEIETCLQKSKDYLNWEYQKKEIVYLAIGRLSQQKNFSELLTIFNEVKKQSNKKVNLLIIGEGSKRNELKEQIKQLRLKQNVKLLGYVENVFPYIKKCDCFVGTPLWESFGLIILEALIFNKPIIYTNTSGSQELLSGVKNGYIAQNTHDFIDKMLDYHSLEKKDGLKKAQRYTFPNIKKHYERLIPQ